MGVSKPFFAAQGAYSGSYGAWGAPSHGAYGNMQRTMDDVNQGIETAQKAGQLATDVSNAYQDAVETGQVDQGATANLGPIGPRGGGTNVMVRPTPTGDYDIWEEPSNGGSGMGGDWLKWGALAAAGGVGLWVLWKYI